MYTAVAVAIYAVVNTTLTFWITRVEKGIVYQGVSPDGEELSIATTVTKNDPTYRLTVTIKPRDSAPQVIKFTAPFATFFDETGRFVAKPFQELFASSVPLIRKFDPKRATSNKIASQDLLDADPDLLDAVLAADPAKVTTSTASDAKSGGKRRKSAK